MQNIPSELIITVKNYINITSFKMKGSPDLGQADIRLVCTEYVKYLSAQARKGRELSDIFIKLIF